MSRLLLQRLTAVLAHEAHSLLSLQGAAATAAVGVQGPAAAAAATATWDVVARTAAALLGWPTAGCRAFTTSAALRQAARDDVPQQGESYYWNPPTEQQPFTFDRRAIADRRATGRLEAALDAVLTSSGVLREQLVERYGFCIHRVHLSKDRRKVFILWDATPGKAQACQHVLEKTAFRLRQDLAKVMRSKHTPYIEFRHDHLPPTQAAAAAAMEAVEQELAAAEAAAAARRAAGQSTAAAAADDSAAEAVVAGSSDNAEDWNAAADTAADSDPEEDSGIDQDGIDAAIRRLRFRARKTRPEF